MALTRIISVTIRKNDRYTPEQRVLEDLAACMYSSYASVIRRDARGHLARQEVGRDDDADQRPIGVADRRRRAHQVAAAAASGSGTCVSPLPAATRSARRSADARL